MASKEELELRKLELEVKEKRWPAVRQMTSLVALIVAVLGAGGFFIDSRLAKLEKAKVEAEIEAEQELLASLEAKREELAADLEEMTDVAREKEKALGETRESLRTFAVKVEGADVSALPELRQTARRLKESMELAPVGDASDYGALLDRRDRVESTPVPTEDLRKFRRELPVDRLGEILRERRRIPDGR